MLEIQKMKKSFEMPMEISDNEIPHCPPLLKIQADALNANEGNLTDCPHCKGKAMIYVTEYSASQGYWSVVAKRCECYQKYKNNQLIRNSGLAHEIESSSFDNYIVTEDWQKELLTAAKNYKDDWFYVGGQVGAGKTMICTSIVKGFLEQGISTVYMPWVSESRKLKSVINDSEYDDRIARFMHCQVLYIDDLFKNRNTGSIANTMSVTDSDVRIAFDILDYRYKNNLKTIISSEFTLHDLNDIDSGISSRIYDRTKSKRQFFGIDRKNKNNYRLR